MEATTVFSLLGGLGLFLFGIKTMGDGLEQAAGSKMKRLLEALTRNKFTAVLVGLLVTAVIQSSSATTVMVVGFVNAGLLSLSKAIGVIMGANIGTTVTSLMLSVKLNFGILFTAVGAICQLAGNRSSFKLLGQIMMGLGILFVGMDAMTAAMEPLRDWQGFRDMMELAKNPLVGVLVGAGVTALLQSSSASVGILQALAATGAISLQASLFILFGQNIGTCVTALLASVGANRTAKRAAVVHLLFNVIGAALFIVLALVLPLASWIETLAGANLRLQIAFAHIIFNVVTTLLLLPISGLLEKLACLVVRGEDKQQEPMRLEYFDARLFSTPPVAVQQLFREVQRMADIVAVNYRFAMQYYFAPKDLAVDEFDNREQVIDYLNAEITQNLIELKGLNLRADDIRLVGSLFHVVNDLERIGDHSMNIVEIGSARKKEKLRFSGKAEREIEELSGIVTSMLDKSIHIVKRQITDVEIIGEVIELESQVDKLCESLADHHVDRVKNKKCTPRNGMLYLDMLNNLERIADHADNLASSVESDHRENRLLW
ncbi:MAG TPA: Na/Pi cotransporter family protein [Candidatus Limiplasma pullistercoris]|nr:Na/Pi cotransporter family protein [Candidatus Limiplasma pullistercoris]